MDKKLNRSSEIEVDNGGEERGERNKRTIVNGVLMLQDQQQLLILT